MNVGGYCFVRMGGIWRDLFLMILSLWCKRGEPE